MRRNIPLPIDEIAARYKAGESTHALGRVYGVSQWTICDRLYAAGVEMRPSGGRLGNKNGLGNIGKPGGPLYTSHGYLVTRDREGRKSYVHRGCWEAYHGSIPDGHVVHHRDGESANNAIENLARMTHGEHSRVHRRA